MHGELLVVIFSITLVAKSINVEDIKLAEDLLFPYKDFYGRRLAKHRERRFVDIDETGIFEIHPSHVSENLLPVSKTYYFISDVQKSYWEKIAVYGHVTKVNNPFLTFSVIEPGGKGGCYNKTKETVKNTSKKSFCVAAQNAGFFNTSSGSCLGNIVSAGEIVQTNGGLVNAHFGILNNGSIIIGYIPLSMVQSEIFLHLVGGVGWLVRNGSSYVEESIKYESDELEETGTFEYFANIQSARTAIGHNAEGQIVMVNVDGQSGVRGVNLFQFANLLISEFNIVNAINLDGGGSATLVLNNTVAFGSLQI